MPPPHAAGTETPATRKKGRRDTARARNARHALHPGPDGKTTRDQRQESHRLPRTPTSATPGTRPGLRPRTRRAQPWGGPGHRTRPGLQPPPRYGASGVPALPIEKTTADDGKRHGPCLTCHTTEQEA